MAVVLSSTTTIIIISTGSYTFSYKVEKSFIIFNNTTHVGQQLISIQHLQDIIDSDAYSKLDHGLVRTDINPKDRQNYRSCEKLTSNDLLNIVRSNPKTSETFVYLHLLKLLIAAYIEKSTTVAERLHSAWVVVFVCRLWWSWLKNKTFANKSSLSSAIKTKKKKTSIDKYFMTKTAYLSVEINAHNLLYLILLVKQKNLPKEVLSIYLFNSQSCESIFRNTRSFSGAYSTIINFTVSDFLRRAEKLSILNQIKRSQQSNNNDHLLFPVHHKHKKDNHLLKLQITDDVEQLDIEQTILDSYNTSIRLIEDLHMSTVLKQHGIFQLQQLSKYVFHELSSASKMFDNCTTNNTSDDSDSDSEREPELDDADNNNNDSDEDSECQSDDNGSISTAKTNFSGIHIKDKITTELKNSYFKIIINNTDKYLHPSQSAIWLLTDKNNL
ncbi:unnamed protein product [Didymodactylos carnosus]|uniref:Uncharacterized protein n=1 Tax=Didymodactylos carnosus TaxID=1234261 RepID=A0A814V0B2_9BILA|nr:unnamed protein product [Didymodactylos carnosus]CAF3945186.1 unnamed protein product [Didymodactylos carnosus]